MSDLVKVGSSNIETMVKAAQVPSLMAGSVTEEDWGAMPAEERRAAIEFFMDAKAETTANLHVTFPRIKYPTSGQGVWAVPNASGTPEFVQTIAGVVVLKQMVRAYWPLDQAVSNNPPTCSSPDAITPVEGPGKQSAHCLDCRWAQFGTGKEATPGAGGAGQACKQRVNVFLLRLTDAGMEEIPSLLSVPPTGLKAFSDYAVQLLKVNASLLGVVTNFGLIDASNRGGTKYKGLALTAGAKLTYDQMRRARAISDAFKSSMVQRGFVEDDDEEKTTATAPGTTGGTVIDTAAQREEPPHPAETVGAKGGPVPF